MKLKEFLDLERGRAVRLAAQLGVEPSMLGQWSRSVRSVSPARCVEIEGATGGEVMRWDLRPDDWRQIWPELVTHPNAPQMTATSTVCGFAEGQMSRQAA